MNVSMKLQANINMILMIACPLIFTITFLQSRLRIIMDAKHHHINYLSLRDFNDIGPTVRVPRTTLHITFIFTFE